MYEMSFKQVFKKRSEELYQCSVPGRNFTLKVICPLDSLLTKFYFIKTRTFAFND